MQRTFLTMLSFLIAITASFGCGEADHAGDAPRDTETQTSPEDTDPGITVDPSVPLSCAEVDQFAQEGRASAVGCEFYSVSLDNRLSAMNFDVILSNVHHEKKSHYTIYGNNWDSMTQSGPWTEVASGSIEPLDQATVQLAPRHIYDAWQQCDIPQARMPEGAYRIVSDVPIVAYQFHPIFSDGTGFTTDASLLLPVGAWSTNYQVYGYRSVDSVQAGTYSSNPNRAPYPFSLAYAAVIAQKDGTELTIDPTGTLRPARLGPCSGDPDIISGSDPFSVTLNAADVLYLHADKIGESLNGTTIRSNADHPIAVFTGHQCARIPEWAGGCDRLEEQLPGIEYWGTEFVATRPPSRNHTNYSDPVLWQIAASEDDTTVSFQTHRNVIGLPEGEVVLQKGEVAEYYVYGSEAEPGDFIIQASKPIAVLEYMTSFETTRDLDEQVLTLGDPSVAYVPPTEQFLLRYVVQIPELWPENHLVITRPAGATLYLDNTKVDDNYFQPVAGGEWEAGRVPVGDGSHIVESEDIYHPFGLIVVGIAEMSSYAFTGGMGFVPINVLQ